MDGVLKTQMVTAVQPVFLSPLVDQLTGFGKLTTLQIIQYLFASYRNIDKINLDENARETMGPYDPAETLASLIKKLEKGI